MRERRCHFVLSFRAVFTLFLTYLSHISTVLPSFTPRALATKVDTAVGTVQLVPSETEGMEIIWSLMWEGAGMCNPRICSMEEYYLSSSNIINKSQSVTLLARTSPDPYPLNAFVLVTHVPSSRSIPSDPLWACDRNKSSSHKRISVTGNNYRSFLEIPRGRFIPLGERKLIWNVNRQS